MRRLPLSLLLIALAAVDASASSVRVQEIGLEGYYATEPVPTRAQVVVSNSRPEPQNIELNFWIRDLELGPNRRENHFRLNVALGPNEQRVLEVPLLIFEARKPVLEVEARDTTGALLARDRRPLERPLEGHLVVILCAQEAACKAAQAGVSFSGTPEEQTTKGKLFKVVAVRQPQGMWWAYAAAQSIVLAMPADRLAREHRSALEEYLRQGGQLVFIEDMVGSDPFLEAYRKGLPDTRPQSIGRGKLYRVSNASAPELGKLFSSGILQGLAEIFAWNRFLDNELSWIRRRLATSFRFPGLRWLLAWLGAYILVVGWLNFTVLRRIGRREWGWLTVPAISLVFAVGLYAASSAERPKQFGADELAVYWMDDRSLLAGAEAALRVSSPRRATLNATVPSDLIFIGNTEPIRFGGLSTITMEKAAAERRWEIRIGMPWQVELNLLQWSFQDLGFRGTRRMPGTVSHAAERRLRNGTGQNLQQAIYVDKQKVYFLGPLAPGAEIDLVTARQEPLSAHTGRGRSVAFGYPSILGEEAPSGRLQGDRDWKEEQKEQEEWRKLPQEPFSLVELIRAWPKNGGRIFESRSGVLFGLSEEPVLGSTLSGVKFMRKNYALTIVSFGREP